MNRHLMNTVIDEKLITGMCRKHSAVTLYPVLMQLTTGYTAKQKVQLWSNVRRDLRRCGYSLKALKNGSTIVYLN